MKPKKLYVLLPILLVTVVAWGAAVAFILGFVGVELSGRFSLWFLAYPYAVIQGGFHWYSARRRAPNTETKVLFGRFKISIQSYAMIVIFLIFAAIFSVAAALALYFDGKADQLVLPMVLIGLFFLNERLTYHGCDRVARFLGLPTLKDLAKQSETP